MRLRCQQQVVQEKAFLAEPDGIVRRYFPRLVVELHAVGRETENVFPVHVLQYPGKKVLAPVCRVADGESGAHLVVGNDGIERGMPQPDAALAHFSHIQARQQLPRIRFHVELQRVHVGSGIHYLV